MILLSAFDAYLCRRTMRVREILAQLNRLPYVFQIIVDQDGKLLGTVTDGDVRRAMLHGCGLDDPAAACMNTTPIAGRVGDIAGNRAKLASVRSNRAFLPVLDESGRVAEVLVREGDDASITRITRALVMAGGFGRRLGERTRFTPKPLLPVAGRPILDHVLTALEDAGVGRVHVSVHYRAEQIRSFVADRTNRTEMAFIEEKEPLGTAGALGYLDGESTGPVLVVNGDVLTRVDFGALHDFQYRHGLDATVGVARYDVEVPFGVVRHDADGLFESIEEKPRISNFIAAGIYYLSPEFIALVPRGRPIDMPELLTLGRGIGLRIGLFPIHEYWTDIGRPDDLDEASRVHRANDGSELSSGISNLVRGRTE